MYDAIVVGARCAGAPTAMLLARKGYRVLLVDKATFPSDVPRGHFIHQPGIACLSNWGLLADLAASNCPPITRLAFDIGPFSLTGSPPASTGITEAYAPRRTVLDKLLVDAAVQAGVEVREGFVVEEVLIDGDQVTGIRGHASGGATVVEKASIVIGADGMYSLVARTVQSPMYYTKPTLTCTYYSYWSDVPIEIGELYQRGPRFIGAYPTNDDLVCIFVFWPHAEFSAVRADIEGNFIGALDLVPSFAERLRSGTRAERFVGTADAPNFYRKPYGPGWALVGDAGYHKDSFLAQGVTDAFRDAEWLTEAIDAGFSGRQPLDEAFASYEHKRGEQTLPMYEFTCQLASLEPPSPEMQQLFGALHGNQAETNRFLGTIAGTVSIPEFYAPENIGQIIAGSSLSLPSTRLAV